MGLQSLNNSFDELSLMNWCNIHLVASSLSDCRAVEYNRVIDEGIEVGAHSTNDNDNRACGYKEQEHNYDTSN
jgi:hypothetical protein